MQAGKLRHSVELQHLVVGSPQQTSTGEPDGTWTTFATVWADIRSVRGIARFTAAMEQSGVEVEIELRHRDGMTAAMRVKEGSVVYDIKSVDETRKHQGRLLLHCARGLNQG